MGRENKFIGLANFFNKLQDERIELTFSKIEELIGEKLCDSAYKYPAYWSVSKTHTLTKVWIENGYKIERLNIKGNTVVFCQNKINHERVHSDKQKLLCLSTERDINLAEDFDNDICIDTVIENIKKYYWGIKSDINARYLSWEHCYAEFGKHKGMALNESQVDYLALHLAFYLASWGMYRGSSFLLQKDYKVHRDIVKELFRSKYIELWSISCEQLKKDENMELLFDLSKALKDIYIEKRRDMDGYKDVSDILITKVLMGTLGCVPAYDRFFKAAVIKYKIASGFFNKNSIIALTNYYITNIEGFSKCKAEISKAGIVYPEMKLIDMAFWQIGFDMRNTKEDNDDVV